MRHGKHLAIGVIVFAMLAAQGIAAPKRPAAKKPAPTPEAAGPAPPAISTFITYDVGTLRMTGKAKDAIYNIGTLRLTGRASASTIYTVGTLSMTGKFKP